MIFQIILFPIILLVTYIGVNLYEPAIAPDFSDYIYRENVPESENGFIFFEGLNAPEGYDPVKFGKLVLELQPKKHLVTDPSTGEVMDLIHFKDFENEMITLECWTEQNYELYGQEICATKDQVIQAIKDNEILLDRYKASWGYERFYVAQLYGFIRGQEIMGLNKLFNAKLVLMAQNGENENALKIWIARQAYFNMVMSDSQSLVFKAITMIDFSRSLKILPIILSHTPQNIIATYREQLDAVLNKPPFGDDGFDIRATLSSEYFTIFESNEMADQLKDFGSEWYNASARILYSKNQTANHYFYFAKDILNASKVHASKARQTFQNIQEKHQPSTDTLNLLYNPIGKLLLGGVFKGAELFDNRIAQQATMTMLRLYVDAKVNGIIAENMSEFIDKSGANYINPYTEKPFLWDQSTNSLYFEQKLEGDTRRHSITY